MDRDTPSEQGRRHRIRVACTPCKIRKRKCNGENPCASCARYDYECYYDRRARTRKAVTAFQERQRLQGSVQCTSPEEPVTNSNVVGVENHSEAVAPATTSDQNMEANAGVVFPRTLSLKLNSITNTQNGDCPGWNLGIRHNPRRSEKSVTWILAHGAWKVLCNAYAQHVHPIYGFLDLESLYVTAQRRWEDSHATNEYDSVICGVAALGSLFSPQANWEQERHLVECAKEILETSGTIANPSLQDAAGWILRTLYLRCSSSPHAAWMASCISLHIVEAMGLHRESSAGTVSLAYADTATSLPVGVGHERDVETKRRIFWIAKLLNTWISFEYGRSRIILHGESCPQPKFEDGCNDHTSALISLFQLSEGLDPNKDIPATVLEDSLKQLENRDFGVDALTLSQTVLAFTIYRRLQLLGSSVNKTVIEHVISLGRRGLKASSRCVDANHPWWHVNNVPFQFTCILLAIDTPNSLVHVRDALTLLKKIACHFKTAKSHQAFETIDMLSRVSLSRKEQSVSVLKESILAGESSRPEIQQQQQFLAQDSTAHSGDGSLPLHYDNPYGLANLPGMANSTDWETFMRDLDFSAAFL
ncbi:Transcription factor [Penicillium occitanis (nom. inval.)]|nr:Transcription factor [Penicillium occitanis (nom. inval.)]PCH03673.1 hypothetical protein PENOC_037610 [Penicillium occitanis (nom. inval.)]